MIRHFLSFAFALAAAGSLATGAFAQDAPNGNVENGKKLFDTIGCFECHGYVGQGGGAGPHLVNPPAWPAFILQLRTPRQVMPPFTTKVLSDQQAADIYAYVKTFPGPVDPKTIPLLQN